VYLMRIGAPGAEKPVARIDDETCVEPGDVTELGIEQLGGRRRHVLAFR
jgi:2,4-didehydro-3-deoxy-L-rhamnonate hydrolase